MRNMYLRFLRAEEFLFFESSILITCGSLTLTFSRFSSSDFFLANSRFRHK